MKKRSALLLAPAVFGAMLLTACGNTSAPVEEEPVESVESVVESTVEEPSETINNLTGLDTLSEDAVGKRPVAVMINNLDIALPQYGVGDADVLYETLVEGGITRMMAVYGDYTQLPSTVGSVRSCRYYYPILAEGMDAVYLHSGVDPTIATKVLADLGIDRYDSDPRLFQRDQGRLSAGYALEHTMMLQGENLPSVMAADGMRSDYREGKDVPIFKFRAPGDLVQPDNGVNPCTGAVFQFSPAYYSTFTYDAATHTYLKMHNGAAHMDAATGEQLAYTNLFALETTIEPRDSYGRMDVDWKGGTGYYISDGAYQKIRWSKPTEQDPITITDLEGNELTVNAGKSYIGILKPDSLQIMMTE